MQQPHSYAPADGRKSSDGNSLDRLTAPHHSQSNEANPLVDQHVEGSHQPPETSAPVLGSPETPPQPRDHSIVNVAQSRDETTAGVCMSDVRPGAPAQTSSQFEANLVPTSAGGGLGKDGTVSLPVTLAVTQHSEPELSIELLQAPSQAPASPSIGRPVTNLGIIPPGHLSLSQDQVYDTKPAVSATTQPQGPTPTRPQPSGASPSQSAVTDTGTITLTGGGYTAEQVLDPKSRRKIEEYREKGIKARQKIAEKKGMTVDEYSTYRHDLLEARHETQRNSTDSGDVLQAPLPPTSLHHNPGPELMEGVEATQHPSSYRVVSGGLMPSSPLNSKAQPFTPRAQSVTPQTQPVMPQYQPVRPRAQPSNPQGYRPQPTVQFGQYAQRGPYQPSYASMGASQGPMNAYEAHGYRPRDAPQQLPHPRTTVIHHSSGPMVRPGLGFLPPQPPQPQLQPQPLPVPSVGSMNFPGFARPGVQQPFVPFQAQTHQGVPYVPQHGGYVFPTSMPSSSPTQHALGRLGTSDLFPTVARPGLTSRGTPVRPPPGMTHPVPPPPGLIHPGQQGTPYLFSLATGPVLESRAPPVQRRPAQTPQGRQATGNQRDAPTVPTVSLPPRPATQSTAGQYSPWQPGSGNRLDSFTVLVPQPVLPPVQGISASYDTYINPVELYTINTAKTGCTDAQSFLNKQLKDIVPARKSATHTTTGFIEGGNATSFLVLHNAANPFKRGEPPTSSTSFGAYGFFHGDCANEIHWQTRVPGLQAEMQQWIAAGAITLAAQWTRDMPPRDRRFHRGYWLAANSQPLGNLLNRAERGDGKESAVGGLDGAGDEEFEVREEDVGNEWIDVSASRAKQAEQMIREEAQRHNPHVPVENVETWNDEWDAGVQAAVEEVLADEAAAKTLMQMHEDETGGREGAGRG